MGLKTVLENSAKAIWAIALSAIGLILIMWILNICGLKELNYIFFFLGGIAIFMAGINPITLIASIFVGGISGKIDGKGFFKGTKQGVNNLFHFVNGIAYAFVLLSGIASVISFKESPSSFFAILVAATILCSGASYMKKDIGRLITLFTTIFVIYICLRAFWAIVPVDTKINLGMSPDRLSKIENLIGTGKDKIRTQINAYVEIERVNKEREKDSLEMVNSKIEQERLKMLNDKKEERRRIYNEEQAKKKRKEVEERLNNNFGID